MLEAVRYLVEELGDDVSFVADTGETAMHAAAYRGANSVVQLLFDYPRRSGSAVEVDPRERCRSGET